MKTKILNLILALSSALSSLCQTPQGINYQAIARGSDGKEITETTLQVRLSILSDSTGYYSNGLGIAVWEEQQTVTTNSNGFFTLVLGNPAAIRTRGTVDHFSDINWNTQPLFIGTKIYYQDDWKIMGAAKLWSVPYSILSGDLYGPVKKLAVTASPTSGTDEALFEVKNKTGQTIFAVYNQGVRIYVDSLPTKAGTKSGFAIGGFGTVKAGESQPLFIVHPDSIRAYIGTNNGKGLKGGFAIGGFNAGKGTEGEEYLRITRDSAIIAVSEEAKGTKGGFAIGSFNPNKGGPVIGFTSLKPDNYFIGHKAGGANKLGVFNSFIGYEAGKNNYSGESNVFLGYNSGFSNINGNSNVFMGNLAGYSNTAGSNNVMLGDSAGYSSKSSYNVFLGKSAGRNNNLGSNNTFLGFRSGMKNYSGSNNVFLGYLSGFSNNSGTDNIFLGSRTGFLNYLGKDNVFLGTYAGYSNSEGCYNVFIGYYAGEKNIGTGPTGFPGNYNVFVGNQAGRRNETGQSNVFIGNFSGSKIVSGSFNTFMGRNTGGQMTSGDFNVIIGGQSAEFKTGGGYNVIIGPGAGSNNKTGSMNVFIGSNAGSNTLNDRSGMLYIENSDSETPLIGGDFTADRVAINGLPVSANFEVNGSFRLGYQGSNLSSIVKATVLKDLPSIDAETTYGETFSVPGANMGGSVMVSPALDLTDGLVIAYARVTGSGEVTVTFRNTKTYPINNPSMNWYIGVLM